MTLLRFEPMKQCVGVNQAAKRWLEENSQYNYHSTNKLSPRTNVSENDDSIFVSMDLPGVKKEDIKLTIEDNILTIEGKKAEPQKDENTILHRNERVFGEFNRAFTLPKDVETDSVKANFVDGVLTIDLKKYVPAAKQERAIEIN